ncbi:muramidase family protein [Lacticaseibacillus absianus]|uniref:muramidase family protein n=1 Tax=Lacticaseibacillus absianus TaxID=2729623 RepID=UPI0015CB4F75|nr:LysM peptidoglycan-binding domain-containing protein [Lacticaseibacillus absianus]
MQKTKTPVMLAGKVLQSSKTWCLATVALTAFSVQTKLNQGKTVHAAGTKAVQGQAAPQTQATSVPLTTSATNSALTQAIAQMQASSTATYSAKVSTFLNRIMVGSINGWGTCRVLPSLTAAQAILESGWGTSKLATQAHNLFGIKGSYNGQSVTMPTQEFYGGAYHTINAAFRAYGSEAESVIDHAQFLMANSRYAAVLGQTDAVVATRAIYAAGYATDPSYPTKLQKLISSYNLTAWDRLAFTFGGQQAANPPASGSAGSSATTSTVYVVKAGDTLTAIAVRFGTTVSAIVSANGLSNPNKLSVGQKLTIGTKPTNTTTGGASSSTGSSSASTVTPPTPSTTAVTYVVRAGDTLYAIATKNKTTVAALVSLNGLKDPNKLRVGQKLTLRRTATTTPTVTTPSKTPAKPTTPTSTAATYTVKRGDTLYAIALKYKTTVAALVSANGLKDPNKLSVGQKLKVNSTSTSTVKAVAQPATPAKVTPVKPAVPAKTTSSTAKVSLYTVQRGDTLSAIARKFKTTVAALVKANNIKNPSYIYVGEQLKLTTTVTAPVVTASGTKQVTTTKQVTYTVKRGDTLYAIAAKHGTTVAAITKANNIKNASYIYIGEQLKIG